MVLQPNHRFRLGAPVLTNEESADGPAFPSSCLDQAVCFLAWIPIREEMPRASLVTRAARARLFGVPGREIGLSPTLIEVDDAPPRIGDESPVEAWRRSKNVEARNEQALRVGEVTFCQQRRTE